MGLKWHGTSTSLCPSAFDAHAIEAFEAGAIDYLLKPVGEARLQKALERAKSLQGKPTDIAAQLDQIASAVQPPGALRSRKITGRSGEDYYVLDLEDVVAFQAEGELVWIVTSKQRLFASQTLRAIEEILDDPQFPRVHRNAIVNVGHVRKIKSLSSQRLSP